MWLTSANGGNGRIWGGVVDCCAVFPAVYCIVDADGNCRGGCISHTAWCDRACWSITACQCSHSMPNEGVCDNVEDKLFPSHQLILALLGDLSLMLLATFYKAAG